MDKLIESTTNSVRDKKQPKADYVALANMHLPGEDGDISHLPFPLHSAAKRGKINEVRDLLATHGVDAIFRKDAMDRTPLHWAATFVNHKHGFRCVKAILDHEELTDDDRKRLCDLQDTNGETALHLAAKNESKSIALEILKRSADVNIRSADDKEPLELIFRKIPEVMVELFDNSIRPGAGWDDPCDKTVEIEFNFGSIVGHPAESLVIRDENNKAQYRHLPVESKMLAYALHGMETPSKEVLTHPLVQMFLELKWKKIRTLFYGSILFHILWLCTYTMFIVDVYLQNCPYNPEAELDNHNDSLNHERVRRRSGSGSSSDAPVTSASTGQRRIRFSWLGDLLMKNEADQEADDFSCDLGKVSQVTTYLLLLITMIVASKELFEFYKVPHKINMYFMRMENMGQWLLITSVVVTSWPVFALVASMPAWQYQVAAFGIFLAWTLILGQIGKLPRLGIYVEMLATVLKSFALFMMTFASLLIAFALSLSIIMSGSTAFSTLPLSILKVLMMMVGELNYDDVFHGEETITPFPAAGHIIFGIFAVMVTIILINLLIGVTVSDIQGLRQDAEVSNLSGKLEQIFLMESFLMARNVQKVCGKKFLNRFLVTNAYDTENLTVQVSIKKVPSELQAEVRRLATRNSIPEDERDPSDVKREQLKHLLKTITNEILAKLEL